MVLGWGRGEVVCADEQRKKIEPGVLGMVRKSVFVEICLRMLRNVMSQKGLKDEGERSAFVDCLED